MNESLPQGWLWSVMDDVLSTIKAGKSFKCEERPPSSTEVGVVKVSAVTWGRFDELESKTVIDSERINPSYFIENGDFLFSRANTIELVGRCVIVHNITRRLMLSDKILRFQLVGVLPQWILLYLSSISGRYEIERLATGNQQSMRNIGQDRIRKIRVPLAPVPEQHRIVAKIEELFSELDKGIESLKTAREQLKVYRQAILKHAFEGKLTPRWREENQDKLETAEQLLERIKQEREAHYQREIEAWERAFREWESNGKGGNKPAKPAKPAELDAIREGEFQNLPALPTGWLWIRYGNLCSLIRNGISKKPEGNRGAKIFRISAVRPMQFDYEDFRFIDNSSGIFNDYYLSRGDLVFTRYNGSRSYVGVCAEYKSDGMHLFPDKLIQTQIAVNSILPSFLEKAINAGFSRRFIERRIRTTAGQSGISGSDIKSMPVPISSLEEQTVIIGMLEEQLSAVYHLENDIDFELSKAETLRQSILKKAFSGKLVAQDSDDEPASVLLARIQEEKASVSTPKKHIKTKRKEVA